MSDKCPLCGNRRLQDSLFCTDCTKKVQTDYEVVLPERVDSEINKTTNSVEDELPLNFKRVELRQRLQRIKLKLQRNLDGDKSITEEPVEENYYNKSEN